MGTPLDTDASLVPDDMLRRLFDCIDAVTLALPGAEADDDRCSVGVERLMEALAALADAADEAALPGLIDLSALLAERISAIGWDQVRQESLSGLLAQLPMALMDYVASPADPATCDALLDLVRSEDWQTDTDGEQLELLQMLLCSPRQSGAAESLAAAELELREAESELSGPIPAAGPASLVVDASQVQSVTGEMLALAAEAFEASYVALSEALALAAHEDQDRRPYGCEQLQDELARMASGAEAIGLAVLAQLLLGIQASLSGRQADSDTAAASAIESLAALPELLRGYLGAPTELPQAESLADLARDLGIGAVLLGDRPGGSDFSDLALALGRVELVAAEIVEAERRPVVAEADDVSLALPEDINPELLEGLLTELPIQTSAFTEAVQRIASGHGRTSDIEIAKRAAHTLKGAANTVGIRGIANLTHYLEDILIELADRSVLPNLGLSQTLGYAADCLEAMSEALADAGEAPEDAVNVLQDVLNWANRIEAQGIEVAAAEPASAEEPEGPAEPAASAADPRMDHVGAPVLRVPTTLVDEQLRLVGESMTSTAQVQNRLQVAMQQVAAVNLQNRMLRQLVNELEDLVDLRGIALPQPAVAETGFDSLELDQYGELHSVARRLVEVATDASELTRGAQDLLSGLDDLVGAQTRLHLASQNAVLRARMVPVSSVVARLQRAVRQAGRLLDKEVELALKGTDTLIDGNVLNTLVDTLMHVLRNAVDHGIEPVGERLASGKDAVGHIELAFKREGDVITVSCRDDGAGLDLERIRRVAQRRDLVGAADALSDDEVARLILAAGFSTRDDATQVSGRGIGLDAVSAMVEELKGSVGLRSERGRGLTVEIRLPTTLLSAQGLLVRVQGTVLAIATRGIEEIRFVTEEQLQKAGSQRIYRQGDRLYDVVRLVDLVGLGGTGETEGGERAMLTVRLSSGVCKGVVVEAIAESRSLVVKKLGRYVGRIDGVIGATILGDGSVAPVIDLPDLLRAASRTHQPVEGRRVSAGQAATGRDRSGARPVNAPTALVVDDSISARRTTAQLFQDAGFQVQTAIDGLEAVAILDRLVPDVIMTDLEMPRMNGLELAAHVRAKDSTKSVPIVMITSRSTEKHRQQAHAKGVDLYLTKPFSPNDLMRQVADLAGR
jgi:chemotaxis protein histidine kinase CheA